MTKIKDRLEEIADIIADTLVEYGYAEFRSASLMKICRHIALESYRVIINNKTIEPDDEDRAIISMDQETVKLFLREMVVHKSDKTCNNLKDITTELYKKEFGIDANGYR